MKWRVYKEGWMWRVDWPSGKLWANYNSWHVAYHTADLMARKYREAA